MCLGVWNPTCKLTNSTSGTRYLTTISPPGNNSWLARLQRDLCSPCTKWLHSVFVDSQYLTHFYSRGASDARVLAVIVCLCVSLSVCVCVCHTTVLFQTAKRRITQITPRDSTGTLVSWRQKSLVDDPKSPDICAQSDPPFKHHNFDQYPHVAPQS